MPSALDTLSKLSLTDLDTVLRVGAYQALALRQEGLDEAAAKYALEDRPDHIAAFEAWMHPGQHRAWDSTRRFVAVLAGTQSGKSVFGPYWLYREILNKGAGDYIAVTATYDLFKLKMLPALLDLFVHRLGIGQYRASDRVIDLPSLNARIILRSAESGGGLESSTAKAAWLDEAGQDSFGLDAWEAVLRRLAIHQGRALLTTTIYNLGWLKSAVYDKWVAGSKEFDVIQFDSTENPAFPVEEFERARASMPIWRFNMFYRGKYERPAGLIYDCFDRDTHVLPAFTIPPEWPRYLGLDFGGVNTAGVFLAGEEPTGKFYLYREYHAGSRTASQHTTALLSGEPGIPVCVGGSKSEGQWRREFQVAGLPIREPRVSEVEVGIQRVYGLFKQNQLFVFDTCVGLIDELQSYSRKLDSVGEPTEDIQDKSTYHRLDSLRYIGTRIADKKRVGVVL